MEDDSKTSGAGYIDGRVRFGLGERYKDRCESPSVGEHVPRLRRFGHRGAQFLRLGRGAVGEEPRKQWYEDSWRNGENRFGIGGALHGRGILRKFAVGQGAGPPFNGNKGIVGPSEACCTFEVAPRGSIRGDDQVRYNGPAARYVRFLHVSGAHFAPHGKRTENA